MDQEKIGLPTSNAATGSALQSQDPSHSSNDLEKGSQASQTFSPVMEERSEEEGLLAFSDDDLDNPLLWPTTKRYTITLVVSLCGLVSLMTASVVAPALSTISTSLSLSPESTSLTLSIYLLAFAIGPLIVGPCSELFGRRPVWLICHFYFILWNSLCPVGKTPGMMIIGRFMSGIGGSYGVALSGPIMADIWPIEQRGKSLGLSMFAPYLGAAVGPLIGGFATQRLTWPWLFWVVSIFDAILLFVSFLVVQESYAPILLERKARWLEKETGRKHSTVYEKERQSRHDGAQTGKARILEALRRPFVLFIRRPIIVIASFFMAYMFGSYVIALTTIAEIYTTRYHTSISTSSLHYIPVSIGSAGSSLITGYFTDRIFAYFKRRAKDGATSPEFRVPLMVPGTLLMPIGLTLYGCAAQKTLHWIVTDLGIFIFVFGLMSASQCGNAYLVDEFGNQYASANAVLRFVVNIVGFCFPLFAPSLYGRLGYGWGNGLIAATFVVLGLPIPLVLWKHGERIRQVGKG